MSLMKKFIAYAKQNRQRIVLPEGTEERTLKAADRILADEVADLILLGNKTEIFDIAGLWGLGNIQKATIIDPDNNPKRDLYANMLFELRKSKGMTFEEAQQKVLDPLYLGCLIIKNGEADGQLAGARNTTSNVLRPALQIIKTAPGISLVSGAFIMITNTPQYGNNGVILLADCAVNPLPDAEQLAHIAISSAATAGKLLHFEEPRVAMLSFSTRGSARHEVVDKVRTATEIARKLDPNLKIDGELQADAAIVPSVSASKAPGSVIEGKANVLIFPNLETGNISYKLIQRLAGVRAIGPILQGIDRPINDLSRGCSIDDIYNMVAITANQAIAAKEQL